MNRISKKARHLKHKTCSWLKQVLRSLRLLIFMAISPWRSKQEDSKVAFFSGWAATWIGLLVHVLPLTAAIVLITFHTSGYHVESPESSMAVQFLVKFLELLAQASIGSTVFSYLRLVVTDRHPIPFGALFAGLQATHVSYLWSLEFSGVVASQWFRWSRKIIFLILIPISVILASGIGPSYAIAMIPSLGDSPSGWSNVWLNATEKEIFSARPYPNSPPYNLTTSCNDGNCLYHGWQNALRETALRIDERDIIEFDQYSSVEIKSTSWPDNNFLWDRSGTIITVTPPFVYSLLQGISFHRPDGKPLSFNISVHTRQPIFYVSCIERFIWLNSTAIRSTDVFNPFDFNSKALNHPRNETSGWQIMFMDDNNVNVELTEGGIINSTRPSLWIAIMRPSDQFGNITICVSYGAYFDSKIMFSPIELRSQNLSGPGKIMEVPPAWADQILPPIERLVDAGIANVNMGMFLSNLFAISTARLTGQLLNAPLGQAQDGRSVLWNLPSCDDWYICWDLLKTPKKKWFGSSVKDHNLFGADENDTEGKYMLRAELSAYSFAYRIDRPSKAVAIVILSAYCLYTFASISNTVFFNRTHSNSWDTIA